MNPVLILTHNCLELTKKCVESVKAQDIEICIRIIDTGSTDGTVEWLQQTSASDHYKYHLCGENIGVSKGWNWGLNRLFHEVSHVLVVNNDTILPPYFYRHLLHYPQPLVTGASEANISNLAEEPPYDRLVNTALDFSAFLIRRECWERVGPFDENMKFYAQDVDYHRRICEAGIGAVNCWVPFYHERSSTLRLASPEERREIEIQADVDRAVFKEKWRVGAND